MGQKISKDELVYQQVIECNVDAIKALFTEGARLEWIDKEGKTPLIVASMDPRLYIVAKTLIELGANVSAYRPGSHAGTPLHHAAESGLDHTVKLLLLHGANPFARTDDCQTPLDVARTKGHCNVVRAIEAHICYFSGDIHEILVVPGILGYLVPGILGYLVPQRLARKSSKKSWVVVVPCGLPNTTGALKLELAVYSSSQDPQPRTVIPLWKSNIVEPKFHESDPTLEIFNESTGTRYKFLSAVEGHKQQLAQLYGACKGFLKVMPPPRLSSTGTSSQPEANTGNQPEFPAGLNSQSSSATNGWGDLDGNVTDSECGPSSVPPPSSASCNGWADEPTTEELNGWAGADLGPSMPTVSPTTVASEPVSSAPSAPPLPVDVVLDGPIHYPAIEVVPVDLSVTSNEAKGSHAGTPLHHAAESGLDHTVKLLLLHGANPFARTDDCQTPLDVARTKGHCNVVRAIEAHICYFSGDIHEILVVPGILGYLVPGILGYLVPQRLARKSSKKSWVVVVPCGLPNTTGALKLELAVYSSSQDPQPRTVIPLWKSNIVEPKFHESDPTLEIFNESTGTRYKFLSAVEGHKQQLAQLYGACKGFLKVMPPPRLSSTGTSSQPEANTGNQPEFPAGLNSQSSSATNGWGDLDGNVTDSECGPSSVPPPSSASCNGWADEPTTEELNGWAGADLGPSMPTVSPTTVASEPVSSAPSAPPLPVDVVLDGPIHYPAIEVVPVDLSVTSNEAKGSHAGTPLHHAAESGLDHTVKLLLLHGANPFARTDDCQTPLDVARTKGHCNVVRAIEAHICYFSGDIHEILVVPGILGYLVPGILGYLVPQRLARKSSKKSWVVVVPCGLPNTTGALKLELAVYSSSQDPQPRTVIPLWKSNIVEPKFHESDPTLEIFNESTGTRYKFLSAVEGHKQQLAQLYGACKGFLKVMPPPRLSSTGTSSQPEANTGNQPEFPAGLNSQSSSATNGWGDLDGNVTHSECGLSSVPPPSNASCNGWADEPTTEELNGWAGADLGPSMPTVSPTTVASEPVSSAPSAPPLPVDVVLDGPIHYPAIDVVPVDFSVTSNVAKGKNDESCCVICWEAPVEGACIPCGHMAGCMSCLSEIKSKNGLCPVCRAKIDQVIRLYAV